VRYDSYRYLWPPRPETAAAPNTLRHYEERRWWGSAKMNGTCTTIYVPPDRKGAFAMGRHGPDNVIKSWQPGERWNAFQATLPGDGWYVFVGELLHSKGVGVKDTMYLFDLLVDGGDYLLGTSYSQRWHRLAALCQVFAAEPFVEVTHTVIAPGVWLASNHARGFTDWLASIQDMPGKPPIEGLVFKDPNARLLPCTKATANAKWQHKCRRATNHLSF
jgi:hypothetical protein